MILQSIGVPRLTVALAGEYAAANLVALAVLEGKSNLANHVQLHDAADQRAVWGVHLDL